MPIVTFCLVAEPRVEPAHSEALHMEESRERPRAPLQAQVMNSFRIISCNGEVGTGNGPKLESLPAEMEYILSLARSDEDLLKFSFMSHFTAVSVYFYSQSAFTRCSELLHSSRS